MDSLQYLYRLEMARRTTTRRARRSRKANACSSFCKTEYIPEVRRNHALMLGRMYKYDKRKHPDTKRAGYAPVDPTPASAAMQMRACKRLYCNTGCAGFPFSKKAIGAAKTKKAKTPHLKKGDLDNYAEQRSIYGKNSGPTYWSAPLGDFDNRNRLKTVAELRRRGATTMCARDVNPFRLTNPDWLDEYKMEEALDFKLKER